MNELINERLGGERGMEKQCLTQSGSRTGGSQEMSLVLDPWKLRSLRQPGKDTTGWLMSRRHPTWILHVKPLAICWTRPFPHLGAGVYSGEELSAIASLLPPAGGSKKDGSEKTQLSMCGSSQRSLEASLTGMEFNHNAHCGKALFWSKQRVTNKMTLRPIHLSCRISELYFVWVRMEIPKKKKKEWKFHLYSNLIVWCTKFKDKVSFKKFKNNNNQKNQ